MSVASLWAPRALAASAMRRSAAGTRGSREDSAFSWRAAAAARPVSPSARYARTRPARIWGRSSGRGLVASASRKRLTATSAAFRSSAIQPACTSASPRSGWFTGVVVDEPVQEIEGAVQVALPGQRDAAPERDLRRGSRPRRAALDDLVPERPWLRRGGPAGAARRRADSAPRARAPAAARPGARARERPPPRPHRRAGAPGARARPRRACTRGGGGASGSAGAVGALGAGRGRERSARWPRAAPAHRARRTPSTPGRRADRRRGSPRRTRAPPGSCPRPRGPRRTPSAPRPAGRRRTRRRTRPDRSASGGASSTRGDEARRRGAAEVERRGGDRRRPAGGRGAAVRGPVGPERPSPRAAAAGTRPGAAAPRRRAPPAARPP